jgi:hypothetical protein
MPIIKNNADSDSDTDEEIEETVSAAQKLEMALNTIYDKTGTALLSAKPYVHLAWIPLVLFLGSREPPHPSLFDLVTPPM